MVFKCVCITHMKIQCSVMVFARSQILKNQDFKKNGVSSTRSDRFSDRLVWQSEPLFLVQTNHNKLDENTLPASF